MKVDRSKFLIVVGALSAATGVVIASTSCTVNSTSTKSDAGTTDLDSGNGIDNGDGAVNDDAGDGGNNACLGDLPDASAPDDAGDAGDAATGCAALTGNGCATACDDVATKFRSAVADDIRSCLMPAPSCEGVTPSPVAACVAAAAAKACDDPAATTTCTPLVAGCGGADAGDAGDGGLVFDQATCEKVVRPLNQAGRDAFTSCVTEGISGGCAADLAFCIQTAQFQ